jgi:hypothetical protein
MAHGSVEELSLALESKLYHGKSVFGLVVKCRGRLNNIWSTSRK